MGTGNRLLRKEVINMKDFYELPLNVQEQAKKTLRSFDEVNVIFEYGEYHVSAGIAVKSRYADDHEYIGHYKADDIFTPEERIINYVESFHSYPVQYKGKRDYNMINSLTWDDRVKFDEEGNIVKR
jgi:hypothetical protein